jgi:hypothetical protein
MCPVGHVNWFEIGVQPEVCFPLLPLSFEMLLVFVGNKLRYKLRSGWICFVLFLELRTHGEKYMHMCLCYLHLNISLFRIKVLCGVSRFLHVDVLVCSSAQLPCLQVC